jgi:hypothetical protein
LATKQEKFYNQRREISGKKKQNKICDLFLKINAMCHKKELN